MWNTYNLARHAICRAGIKSWLLCKRDVKCRDAHGLTPWIFTLFCSLLKGNIVVSQEFTLQDGKYLLEYWKWRICHSGNDLLSLRLLCLLSQNFCALSHSMCSTNTHCQQSISTYFSYLLNRWKFWDELHSVSQSTRPRHSVITTDKRAHRYASYARKSLLHLCTDKVLNGQLGGLNIPQTRQTF